jgi:hypothetical protein
VDGQARRSGTRRRRRWCNRGLVGLHAQVSAVAQRPDSLPGSDSIRRPQEGGLGGSSRPGSLSPRCNHYEDSLRPAAVPTMLAES